MKKKIASLLCAVVLAMALPTLAFAAPSPIGGTVTDGDVAMNVAGEGVEGSGNFVIDVADADAKNAEGNILASFEIVINGDLTFDELTLAFNVGTEYAGAKATVYIEHGDGTTEVKTATVGSDGVVTITVDKLSIFTIAVEKTAAPSKPGADSGATSPQTGVSLALAVGATLVCAAGAGVTGAAIRRR